MGSSKKHKEKEKERESRKRPRSYRSRSRSKERHREREREREKEKSSEKHRRDRTENRETRDRKRSRDDHSPPHKIRARADDSTDAQDDIPKSSGGGGDNSISIQETNKIRAKLGLKPLELSDGKDTGDGGEKKDEFVHKPAENIRDKQFIERIRSKLAIQREKRQIQNKLNKVKGLAESDSDEDIGIWVEKSRRLQAEKDKADKRAKLLEEMDEEFGIGSLVEDEFLKEKQKAYNARHLRGMRVEHSHERFKEGSVVVLALKDKGILDEEEDVLINVNIVDDEKAEKNREIRKAKPGYVPYAEQEVDDLGMMVKPSMLKKYDEEIEGDKKTSFRLGAKGEHNLEKERERKLVMARLLQQQRGEESLDTGAMTPMSEYLTEAEMVQFKKPKKVRKVRRKPLLLKADQLLSITSESENKDHGYRAKGKGRSTVRVVKPIVSEAVPEKQEDMDVDMPDFDDPDILGPDEDLTGVAVDPDEAELELQMALSKARKMKYNEAVPPQSEIKRIVGEAQSKPNDGEVASDSQMYGMGGVILNSTAEFCRALGDIPTYGLSGNRDEDMQELLDMGMDRDAFEDKRPRDFDDSDGGGLRGAWNKVEVDEPAVVVKREDAVTILEEEPDVGVGIAGALQLAMKKGYLEMETKKMAGAHRHSQLEATSYAIEDKSFFEDDKLGRRERYSAGPVSEFKDKDGYRPDVKLEYIDDNGRLLNPKEAFRYLSHKFHGKGSGKNKTEKRMKKQQEEALMKQMSSTDTPLGTLALLQEKQKQTQSPYVLLSGGNKALSSAAISKVK